MIRTYSDLKKLNSFEDRFEYLKLSGSVGYSTFGFERFLNQKFYTSYEWQKVRRLVILRDNACDLGVLGYELPSRIVIHHMNPISLDDVKKGNPNILNPEYLISSSNTTHLAIHFGESSSLPKTPKLRLRGDTKLW